MHTRLRLLAAPLAVVLALTTAVAFAAPASHHARPAVKAPTSSAQTVSSLQHIAVTGTTSKGRTFTGTFSIRRFVVRKVHGHRAVFALGTLRGTDGTRTVRDKHVMIPVTAGSGAAGTAGAAQAGCPILNLVLGPLHLNLLGLHVDLNRVVLNITAVPGPGNLLGNLLCGIANLLNNNPVTGQTLADVLNTVGDLLRGL